MIKSLRLRASRRIRISRFFNSLFILHKSGQNVLITLYTHPHEQFAIRAAMPDWRILDATPAARAADKLGCYGAFIERLTTQARSTPQTKIAIWGYREVLWEPGRPLIIDAPVYRFEDGFIRSLGTYHKELQGRSVTIDSTGIYYDCHRPSDLENMLNTFDFGKSPGLLEQAERMIDLLRSTGVSKYNTAAQGEDIDKYFTKGRENILVLGQKESDLSISFGTNQPLTNNELVWRAWKENQGANIIYKPHPQVLQEGYFERSHPANVEDLCVVAYDNASLSDFIKRSDKVYAITSLAGFEALLYGKPVVTLGAPFYSGWGLTDDRTPVERRNRRLSIEEVFAAAYILYSVYFDPHTGERTSLENTIRQLSAQQAAEAGSSC